jgi:ABC-type branched-subunit amino acid transport system ATPase component
VSDRFVIMDRGQVVMEKTRAEIPSSEVLVQQMQRIAQVGKEAEQS